MGGPVPPWLVAYFKTIAESAQSVACAPRQEKTRKLQIERFLTFLETPEDDCVWAIVGDSEVTVPAKFTSSALKSFKDRTSAKDEGRLTKHKHAILTVKEFKPFCARIPLGSSRPGMSAQCHLALEINHIKAHIGHVDMGTRIELESAHDLKEWAEALRNGSNATVLRDRKKALMAEKTSSDGIAANKEQTSLPSLMPSHASSTALDALSKRSSDLAQKQQQKDVARSTATVHKTKPEHPYDTYRRSWKGAPGRLAAIIVKPPDIEAVLSGLSVMGEEDLAQPDPGVQHDSIPSTSPAARQTTPPEWEPTQPSCASPSQDSGPLPIHLSTTPKKSYNSPHGSPAAPCSPPASSPVAPYRARFSRRVPAPQEPPACATDISGPGNILVPNSDISMSQSQSQPRSQTKPETDQHSSQPHPLSNEPLRDTDLSTEPLQPTHQTKKRNKKRNALALASDSDDHADTEQSPVKSVDLTHSAMTEDDVLPLMNADPALSSCPAAVNLGMISNTAKPPCSTDSFGRVGSGVSDTNRRNTSPSPVPVSTREPGLSRTSTKAVEELLRHDSGRSLTPTTFGDSNVVSRAASFADGRRSKLGSSLSRTSTQEVSDQLLRRVAADSGAPLSNRPTPFSEAARPSLVVESSSTSSRRRNDAGKGHRKRARSSSSTAESLNTHDHSASIGTLPKRKRREGRTLDDLSGPSRASPAFESLGWAALPLELPLVDRLFSHVATSDAWTKDLCDNALSWKPEP